MHLPQNISAPILIPFIAIEVLLAMIFVIFALLLLHSCFPGIFEPSQDIESEQSSNPVLERQPSQNQQAEASTPIEVVYKNKKETESYYNDCAICLGEFRDGNGCRFLSNCKHYLRLNQWLVKKRNCPLCRASVHHDLEAPLSTNQNVDN